MPVPREDLRQAARQDPFAGRGRKRQEYVPQADAHHSRAGLGPVSPGGVPRHHLQQRHQGYGCGRGAAKGREGGGRVGVQVAAGRSRLSDQAPRRQAASGEKRPKALGAAEETPALEVGWGGRSRCNGRIPS